MVVFRDLFRSLLFRSFILGFGFCYEDTWKDAAARDMLIFILLVNTYQTHYPVYLILLLLITFLFPGQAQVLLE